MIDREGVALLEIAIGRLDPVERWVIRERFGIGLEWGGRTRRVMATASGIGIDRLRRIEAAALEKLRGLLAHREAELLDQDHCRPIGVGSPYYVPDETSPAWENMIRAMEDRGQS